MRSTRMCWTWRPECQKIDSHRGKGRGGVLNRPECQNKERVEKLEEREEGMTFENGIGIHDWGASGNFRGKPSGDSTSS